MIASYSMAGPARMVCLLLVLAGVMPRGPQVQPMEAGEIVKLSVEANRRDWKQLPGYDYFVREHEAGGTKTYLSRMLLGSRYNQLVAVNEKPLSPEDAARENQRFENELSNRSQESPQRRQQRIARYQNDIERDRFFMAQLADAFDFVLVKTDTIAGRQVYVLAAKPRPGYRPPNTQAKALTGMQGTLWIDCNDFHWVKVHAEVVHGVSIEGFLARIEPGTHFELEQTPTAEGLWLPSRFLMETRAKVFFFFSHNSRDEEDYFGYRKAEARPE